MRELIFKNDRTIETIAILIPVKNNAHTIKRSLDSIVKQTAFLNKTFNYQIILVDNDSSDNLKNIILNYKNLTYLFCKIPGIVAALNTGIYHIMNMPNIKYIARLDADDYWTENKIEIQFTYLLNNPEIDICGTGIRFIKGNFYHEWHYGQSHEEIMGDLSIGHNPIAHPSVIFKKSIFYKCGGYDETYKYNEDLDLWMRASKHFRFYNMQEVLLHYTCDEKNEEYITIQKNNAEKLRIRNSNINDSLPINR